MKSIFGRRILIVVGMACVLGVFLGLYYFVYAPQQQNFFNKSGFRILEHIASNFKERVDNYGTVIITEVTGEKTRGNNRNRDVVALESFDTSKVGVPVALDIDLASERVYKIDKIVKGDSIEFDLDSTIKKSAGKKATPFKPTSKSTEDILKPIVDVHNNIFESIIFVTHNEKGPDTVLYKSGDIALDNVIERDSLIKKTGAFVFPEIKDVVVEGVKYKLFFYPFRIDKKGYFFAGFLNNHDYKVYSQDFPLSYVISLGLLIMAALMSLPFLKIYLIGAKENISINDVRAIIAMLFIVPFLFILIGYGYLLNKVEKRKSENGLVNLHREVKAKFSQELEMILKQLKAYDAAYKESDTARIHFVKTWVDSLKGNGAVDSINVRDLFFYPGDYKNLDGVFWVNQNGDEISKWNFVDKEAPYLQLSDRQYFKDIKSREGFSILKNNRDTFSIQPTISKASGDYTVNVVRSSDTRVIKASGQGGGSDRAIMVGISGKMYSVFKPVVPKGMNFCIINSKGEIQFHSESDRSLQENIFDELENSAPFISAVNQRDSAKIDGILYERDIRALITPMEGMPYFLVTYYLKRNQHLFTFHVLAFTFLCESLILLLLSLFILFFYFTTKKFTKLFFSPHALEWIKPNYLKSDYYAAILYYQLGLMLLLTICSFLVSEQNWLNYILLSSFLLPFFVVMGYYMLRSAETHSLRKLQLCVQEDREKPWYKMVHYHDFLIAIGKILIPYVLLILLFLVFKVHFRDRYVDTGPGFSIMMWFIVFVVPAAGIALSSWWYYRRAEKPFDKILVPVNHAHRKYLRYLSLGLLVSVLLISVFPTLGLLVFASRNEKLQQAKSNQMALATGIQDHRKLVNTRITAAKYNPILGERTRDSLYINNLKFNDTFGLYVGNNVLKPLPNHAQTADSLKAWNSTFYKRITDYLFLPADHFDFYNNTNEYYWKLDVNEDAAGSDDDTDSLTLYYSNLNDNYNAAAISLQTPFSKRLQLFSNLDDEYLFLTILLGPLFFFGLWVLIISLTKRVFLIGYFETEEARKQETAGIEKVLEGEYLKEEDKVFWRNDRLSLAVIQQKENECLVESENYGEWIILIQLKLEALYEKLWDLCTPSERSVLFDFALDGFTNYRNVDILFSLYRRGLLKKEQQSLAIMTDSFRNYLITKRGTSEIKILQKQVSEGGAWGNLRAIFYVMLFAIVIFMFIVQEDVSKRVLAIVTSLGALIPIVLKLFDAGSGSKSSDK